MGGGRCCDQPGINVIVAEKIRSQIESQSQHYAPKQFTVSIGIACYPINGLTDKSILKAADMALYLSKQKGRNSITVSEWKA